VRRFAAFANGRNVAIAVRHAAPPQCDDVVASRLLLERTSGEEDPMGLRRILRGLYRTPTQTTVAVLGLAVGVAGAVVVFGVVRALLVPPTSYGSPDRIAVIQPHNPPWQLFERLEADGQAFEAVAAYSERAVNFTGPGGAERLLLGEVTEAFLQTVDVRPALGRMFREDDFSVHGGGVALITDRLWRERFGASSSALGRSLLLDGRSYTVVGVLPRNFKSPTELRSGRGLSLEWGARLLVPMIDDPRIPDPTQSDRRWRGLYVLMRLHLGVGLARAQSDLMTISTRIELPPGRALRWIAVPLANYIAGDLPFQMAILGAAVGILMLVASINVANIVLARNVGRQRELATRVALGASRTSLLGGTVVETTLLAVAGGATGLGIAAAGLRAIAVFEGAVLPHVSEISIDPALATVGIGLALAMGLIAGGIASLRVSVVDPLAALRAETGTGGKSALATTLVAAQVASSVILLIAAARLAADLLTATRIDLGFKVDGVLTGDVSVTPLRYKTRQELRAFFQALLEKGSSIPGVRSIALSTNPPGGPTRTVVNLRLASGRHRGEQESDEMAEVIAGDYFTTVSIPIRVGRALNGQDQEHSDRVVAVSEACVRKHWGQNALALEEQVRFGGLAYRVVGVVGNVRLGVTGPMDPCVVYFPYGQFPRLPAQMTVLMLATHDRSGVVRRLREAVKELDPLQPVYNVVTLEQLLSAPLARQRLLVAMVGLFGTFAVLIATIGVYGVTSRFVNERTYEIAVRLAIGASPSAVRRMVIVDSMRAVSVGIATGVALGHPLMHGMASQLIAVRDVDWATDVWAGVAVLGLALISCVGPAFRATRVSPLIAIRRE